MVAYLIRWKVRWKPLLHVHGSYRDGHLPVAEWFDANRTEGCSAFSKDMAAINGHLSVVEWSRTRRWKVR